MNHDSGWKGAPNMAEQTPSTEETEEKHTFKPFVAPCRDLRPGQPFEWLYGGWEDFKKAPGLSLTWGIVFWFLSTVVTYLSWKLGGWALLVSVLSGFVFVAPMLAFALYAVSRQLCMGNKPTLSQTLHSIRKPLGNALVFALVLLVIFLLWARAGTMVHIFFPAQGEVELKDLLMFLGIGSAVGSLFAAFTFSVSVFSLPFIANREVDVVTAVVSSFNAVIRNRWTMFSWALLIVFFTAIGFLTVMLAFVVIFPVLGYAAWHGYRDTLDVEEWPPLPPWD
jgi:uncharacterized membrane protein